MAPPRSRPLSVDLLGRMPWLRDHIRPAIRLHPRPGLVADRAASKLGGELLWPADEPWPTCPIPHVDPEGDRAPLYPVMQVRRDDALAAGGARPDHALLDELFPAGSDLLQMMWCSRLHRDDDEVRLPSTAWFWRRIADVTAPRARAPRHVPATPKDYLVRPCVLHLEQVDDLPHFSEWEYEWRAPPDPCDVLDTRFRGELGGVPSEIYCAESTAPGIKLGGHPPLQQMVVRGEFSLHEPPRCPAGHRLTHLLTFNDERFVDWWRPTPEQWAAEVNDENWPPPEGAPVSVCEPGYHFGDTLLHVFHCPRCADQRTWDMVTLT